MRAALTKGHSAKTPKRLMRGGKNKAFAIVMSASATFPASVLQCLSINVIRFVHIVWNLAHCHGNLRAGGSRVRFPVAFVGDLQKAVERYAVLRRETLHNIFRMIPSPCP